MKTFKEITQEINELVDTKKIEMPIPTQPGDSLNWLNPKPKRIRDKFTQRNSQSNLDETYISDGRPLPNPLPHMKGKPNWGQAIRNRFKILKQLGISDVAETYISDGRPLPNPLPHVPDWDRPLPRNPRPGRPPYWDHPFKPHEDCPNPNCPYRPSRPLYDFPIIPWTSSKT